MAQGLFNSSVGRKFAMALSAFFLLIFLIIHLMANMVSVFSPETFNEVSQFMGTNPLVQFLLQPILLLGVVFHFVMGFVLEIKNRKARGPVAYVGKAKEKNATWMSKYMVVTGAMILLFLILHFGDFWVPTVAKNHFGFEHNETEYEHLLEKFSEVWRVVLYVAAFVLLSFHLMHGFQSAFQSMGANHRRYNGLIKAIGNIYAIVIPLGFIFVAIYHFINQL